MPSQDPARRLRDILEQIALVRGWIDGMSLETFARDIRTRYAVRGSDGADDHGRSRRGLAGRTPRTPPGRALARSGRHRQYLSAMNTGRSSIRSPGRACSTSLGRWRMRCAPNWHGSTVEAELAAERATRRENQSRGSKRACKARGPRDRPAPGRDRLLRRGHRLRRGTLSRSTSAPASRSWTPTTSTTPRSASSSTRTDPELSAGAGPRRPVPARSKPASGGHHPALSFSSPSMAASSLRGHPSCHHHPSCRRPSSPGPCLLPHLPCAL